MALRASRFADSPEFERLARGERPLDLARVALEIARDAGPDLDVEAYRKRIAALAERTRTRCPRGAGPREVLGQIRWSLFVEEKLRGNVEDYYDPRNSYLNEVLDRRLGIPISLSMLYQAVAEPLGLKIAGMNLPGHYMLRVDDPDDERVWFVDPFHEGEVLDHAGCRRRLSDILGRPIELDEPMIAPCPADVAIARLLRNLKAIHLNREDHAAALPVQRRLAALCPGDPREALDLAVLCLNADRPGEALESLQGAHAHAPSTGPVALEFQRALDIARRRLAESN